MVACISVLLTSSPASAAEGDVRDVVILRDGDVPMEVETSDGGWQYYWDGVEKQEPEEFFGNMVWVYDGQQTFYDSDGSVDRIVRFNTADGPPDRWDAVQRVLETVRIDDHGRRWVPAGYDESMLRDALERYEERLRNELGVEPDGAAFARYRELLEEDPQEEARDIVGELEWGMTKSTVCMRAWYAPDENTSLSYPMSAVGNKPAVVIGIDEGGGTFNDANCSGVLVADEWVLTAAHCTTTFPTGATYRAASKFMVCSYGNDLASADCVGVNSVVTQASWANFRGAADDFVLLHLSGTLNSGSLGWLSISSASASTIEGFDSVVTGYPGNIPSGSNHCADNDSTTAAQIDFAAGGMDLSVGPTWDSSSLVDITATLHKSANDLGSGWSGGGYRYEPSSGNWFVTGVVSQFEYVGVPPAVEGAQIGPNHDEFRSWVLANI